MRTDLFNKNVLYPKAHMPSEKAGGIQGRSFRQDGTHSETSRKRNRQRETTGGMSHTSKNMEIC
jgi:hypothetical protein